MGDGASFSLDAARVPLGAPPAFPRAASGALAAPPANPDKACLAAGTRILTPDGDVPVEKLRPGDEVLVVRGDGDDVAKVIWTGRRTIDLTRHAQPQRVQPVRFLAGALGAGLPEHDLWLSPDHCLYIDGHFIEARTLVNGATVRQDFSQRFVSYHHIELARHDVMLAEGVPVETYLDSGNRLMFEGAAATMLHPDFSAPFRAKACAPLAANGPVVLAARQRLLDRAKTLGFAATHATDLVVRAGIEKIRPEARSTAHCLMFELSQPYRSVELLSSAGVPAHLAAAPDDRRRLGADIFGLFLVHHGWRRQIELNDPAHQGFHAMEAGHRWTNGAARIRLPAFTGAATLEVRLFGQAARWVGVRDSAAISA
jgi:hypothetical protein